MHRPSEAPIGVSIEFVVIGAQKGGSTVLANALAQHPRIWMPDGESPVFRDPMFSSDAISGFQQYVSKAPESSVRGIKCPDYLARPEVPARLVSEISGRPALIACLRDPVARAISTYFWHVRWGLLPVENPSDGISKVLDGKYDALNPRASEIIDWSLYAKHLRHYFTVFDRSELLILLNEDLYAKPAETFSRAFSFLGVEDTFVPVTNRHDSNEGVYNDTRLRFLNLRNRYLLEWSSDRTYLGIKPAERGWPRLASRAVAATDRYLLARVLSNDKPVLRSDVVDRMRDAVRPDAKEFEKLLDRSLSVWRLTFGAQEATPASRTGSSPSRPADNGPAGAGRCSQ